MIGDETNMLNINEDVKIQIGKEYLAGRYNEDIMSDFNISKAELYHILGELKIPRKVIKPSFTKTPKCEYCKKPVEIKNAKYCPYCGKIMVTAKSCMDILSDMRELVSYIPTGEDEEYIANIEIIEKFITQLERGKTNG